MQLSSDQQLSLREKLEMRIGDDKTPVSELVRRLIPFEVTDPEGAAAVQRATESLEGVGESIDFSNSQNKKITNPQYKALLEIINLVEKLANQSGNLAQQSEIIVERRLKTAHDTLVNIMVELGDDLKHQGQNLKFLFAESAALKIAEIFRKRAPMAIGERFIESEENNIHANANTVFTMTLDSLTSCHKMLEVFLQVLGVMKENRAASLDQPR